ncbi:AraC family transcriptional regulator [Eubacteriaceae bacterium ES2]|nr:AraC family transcriptional regulator [Eubacteriaceae bacterium ES2]
MMISYLYDEATGIELIFSNHSRIAYPLHNHISVYTLGIVLDGTISLTNGQNTIQCSKNQTFIIYPYIPHRLISDKSYSLLSLCLDKNLLLNPKLDSLIHTITDLLKNKLPFISDQQKNLLIQALEQCMLIPTPPQNSNAVIEQVKKQLELYPEHRISIEEMAKRAFISKYHFIRCFKAEVGLTPHQFQLQNRIRKGQRLIIDADTIAEVALATGFCDQSHFIKQFEKHFGLTPSIYKCIAEQFQSKPSTLTESRHKLRK